MKLGRQKNKVGKEKGAEKNGKDTQKLFNRIKSPIIKTNQITELKKWKSEKQIYLLPQKSIDSLQLNSIIDDKSYTQTEEAKFTKMQKQKDKTHSKNLPVPSKIQMRGGKDKEGKVQNKTKKTSINFHSQVETKQADLELKVVQNENEKLVEQIDLLKAQNENYKQRVSLLEGEKKELEKKIQILAKKENQNKRLIRNKINFFNEESEKTQKIKELEAKIKFLSENYHKPITVDFGVNASENSATDIQVQTQPIEQSVPLVNHEYDYVKQEYEKQIKSLNKVILEQDEQIFSLQKELNQLYEMKEGKKDQKCCFEDEKSFLQEMEMNFKLKTVINEQANTIQQIKKDIKSKEFEIDSLTTELVIERKKGLIERKEGEKMVEFQRKLGLLEDKLKDKDSEIQTLESKIFVQENMLKSVPRKSIIRK